MTLNEFKSHFFYSELSTNLNNAGQALIPDVNQKKVNEWVQRFYQEGALCAPSGWAETDVVRGKLARFLNADVSEVSFFQTTASALSQAAFGIPLSKDDEILTWDQEYPSNFYPWRMAAERSGAKVIQVKSAQWETPVESILKNVTARTKVISISWVQYQTGAVSDLKTLARELKEKNIWLVADVIQGVGVRPFDFKEMGFDIVCGGSHKWLCSSYGGSYMILKKDRLTELRPIEYGAMSFGDPDTSKSFTSQLKDDGRRFEPGSKAMIEIIAMGATLDLFSAVGMPTIYKEASRLADRMREGLSAKKMQIHSATGPIVCFSCPDPNQMPEIEKRFLAAKIAFAPKRGPGMRLSTHAYNRDEDVDRMLNLI